MNYYIKSAWLACAIATPLFTTGAIAQQSSERDAGIVDVRSKPTLQNDTFFVGAVATMIVTPILTDTGTLGIYLSERDQDTGHKIINPAVLAETGTCGTTFEYSYNITSVNRNQTESREMTVFDGCRYSVYFRLDSNAQDNDIDGNIGSSTDLNESRAEETGTFTSTVEVVDAANTTVNLSSRGQIKARNSRDDANAYVEGEAGVSTDNADYQLAVKQKIMGVDSLITESDFLSLGLTNSLFEKNDDGTDKIFTLNKFTNSALGTYFSQRLPLVKNPYEYTVNYELNNENYEAQGSFAFPQGNANTDVEQLVIIIVNQPPQVSNSTLTTNINKPLTIDFDATDSNGDNLTYTIVSQPENGQVSESDDGWIFTPTQDFSGETTFTFTANDGYEDSTEATITITVKPRAPIIADINFNWIPSAGQTAYNDENPMYTFTLQEAGEVELTLDSNIDNYLYLLGSDYKVLVEDNDSGEGTNASVTQTLSAGTYYLVAATNEPDEVGDYTLSLRSNDFQEDAVSLENTIVRTNDLFWDAAYGFSGPGTYTDYAGNPVFILDIPETMNIGIVLQSSIETQLYLQRTGFMTKSTQSSDGGPSVMTTQVVSGRYFVTAATQGFEQTQDFTISVIAPSEQGFIGFERVNNIGRVKIEGTVNFEDDLANEYGLGSDADMAISLNNNSPSYCSDDDLSSGFSFRGTPNNNIEQRNINVEDGCSYDLELRIEGDANNEANGGGNTRVNGTFRVRVDSNGGVDVTIVSGSLNLNNDGTTLPTVSIGGSISTDTALIQLLVKQQIQGNIIGISSTEPVSVVMYFNNTQLGNGESTLVASNRSLSDDQGVAVQGYYIRQFLPLVKTPYNYTIDYTVNGQTYEKQGDFTFIRGEANPQIKDQVVVIVNLPPQVSNGTLTTKTNTSSAVVFGATDPDGDTLSYRIISQPTNAGGQVTNNSGTTSGTDANWVFTPTANFVGTTSFTFKATDGIVDSTNSGTISVTVLPNTTPTAAAQSLTVSEDNSLSITLSGADTDGDNLTFTPSQPQNGSVSGSGNSYVFTPNADFNGNTFFTFTANDGIVSSTPARIDITVDPVNDAPTISGQPGTVISDGSSYQFSPSALDIDGDNLIFSIANRPSWASFNAASGSLTGIPARTDAGITSGILISVSDGTVTASLIAFNIEVAIDSVAPVVSAPSNITLPALNASGIPINDAALVVFLAQVTAVDAVDGAISVITNNLSGTVPLGTTEVIFTATDTSGNSGTASATILITDQDSPFISELNTVTFEATGLQTAVTLTAPTVTDNVDTDLSASASNAGPFVVGDTLITWEVSDSAGNIAPFRSQTVRIVDTTAPAFENVARQTIDAQGRLTNITDLLNITAFDLVDGNIAVIIDGQARFPSGVHQVRVTATDNAGFRATQTVEIAIRPQVALAQEVIAFAGTSAKVPVSLIGNAISYPVVLSYTVSNSGTVVVQEQLEISAGQLATIDFTVDANVSADTQFEVSISTAQNAVLNETLTSFVRVSADNLAPIVTIDVSQQGISTSIVAIDGGDITLSAALSDVGPSTNYTYRWRQVLSDGTVIDLGSDSNVNLIAAALSSGPTSLELTIEELNTAELFVVNVSKDIVVKDTATIASLLDSDFDGLIDAMEGAGDSDDDGIADYLDNDISSNVLPIDGGASVLIAPVGLKLSIGSVAIRASNSGDATGANVDAALLGAIFGETLATDTVYQAVSDIINFKVSGLAQVGDAVTVIVQLANGVLIPNEAVYRKFSATIGWETFIADGNNLIASGMTDDNGNCPAFSNETFQAGLLEGSNCIALTIQDGGIYDADGEANGAVEDPGVLAIIVNEAPTLDVVASASVAEQTSVSVTAFASDPEGAALTYRWLQLSGNTVSIDDETSATLSFTAPDVAADEQLSFSVTVSDGVNEVAGTVVISVEFVNSLPTVSASVSPSAALEQTSVTFSAAATDSDGDVLTYSWAQLSGPSLSLGDANAASFTVTLPAVSSTISAVLQVSVSDGTDTVTADVSVTIQNTAPVTPPSTDSGGGSSSYITLLLLFSVWLSRMLITLTYRNKRNT
jgi:hypothetical protein